MVLQHKFPKFYIRPVSSAGCTKLTRDPRFFHNQSCAEFENIFCKTGVLNCLVIGYKKINEASQALVP